MSSFFSSDGSFSLQFAIIFVVIFLVLAGLLFLIRRVTGRGLTLTAKAGQRGRQPRLGIVDIYELDRQRQLILLRRDNVEHLLLVGGPNDVVVERNILRGAGARMSADASNEAALTPDSLVEPEPPRPQPPAFPDRPFQTPDIPEAPFREPSTGPTFKEPTFEMPVAVPPSLPGSSTPPATVGRPLDLSTARPEPDEERAADASAPIPRRPEPPPGRLLRRTPPPLVNPRPDVASERGRSTEGAFLPAPPAVADRADAPIETAPLASLPSPTTKRSVDPVILSDMTRQLEEALRRPTSAVVAPPLSSLQARAVPRMAPDVEVKPVVVADEPIRPSDVAASAPIEAEPPRPEESTAAIEPATARPLDPMAAAMAASAKDSPVPDDLFDDAKPIEAPPQPEPAKEEEPFLPKPPPDSEPQAIPPEPPTDARPPKPSSQNPFSVEEIEAEFARLLGRPLDRKG